MTTVRQVQGSDVRQADEEFAQLVSGLFFKDSGNRHATHTSGTGNRALGAPFEMEFLDRRLFVRTLLLFGIERAIGVAVCTVKRLLAALCMTILAQIDRATAAAGDDNHARFLFAVWTTWHATIHQSRLDHYPDPELDEPVRERLEQIASTAACETHIRMYRLNTLRAKYNL